MIKLNPLDEEENKTTGRTPRSQLLGKLKELTALSPSKFLFPLAIDWTIIFSCLACAAFFPNPLVIIAAILVIGNRQHAIAVLGHEAAHFLVARNRKLNDWIGMVFCFWPIGSYLTGYRRFHNNHHQHLGTTEDPELSFYRQDSWKLPVPKHGLVKTFIQDMLGLNVIAFSRLAVLLSPTRRLEHLGMIAWMAGFIGICYLIGKPWLALVYLGALPTVFWALVRFRTMTEHRGVAFTHKYSTNWLIRTIFYPHNIWLHHEHHRWCFVPFYNLNDARLLDLKHPVLPWSEVIRFLNQGNAEEYAKKSGQQIIVDDFRDPPQIGIPRPPSKRAKEHEPTVPSTQ